NTSTLWEQRFNSTFSGDEFFLTDHVIKGQRIMPGVAYLEMASVAVREATSTDVVSPLSCLHLSPTVWARPLGVDEHPITVRITLAPQESGTIAFTISHDDTGLAYCQGIVELQAPLLPPNVDLAAVQTRCQQQLSTNECYQRYRELGLDYGPAFQGIEELCIGAGEVLARFRLPVALGKGTASKGIVGTGASPVPTAPVRFLICYIPACWMPPYMLASGCS